MIHTNRRFYYLGAWGGLLLAALGAYAMVWPEEPVKGFAAFAGHAGRLLGLTGMLLLGNTFLLGVRPGPLERYLGLGSLMRMHRPSGVLTLFFLLAHALLLTTRHGLLSGQAWPEIIATYARTPEMLLGQAGLGLLVLAGLAAVLGQFRKLVYAVWKKIHLLAYPGALLGLFHALLRGEEILLPVPAMLWLVVFLILMGGFSRRIFQVAIRRNWFPYVVGNVVSECPDTASVFFAPEDAEHKLENIRPGQFLMLRIKGKGGWSEPHPFTIAAQPEGDNLCVCIKRAGAFTERAHALQPDDKVLLCGPYGLFCKDALNQRRLCFIAGGMGVTPFLSLLRSMRGMEKPPEVRLIWSVHTYDQAFALEELRELQKELSLQLTILCSREFGERLIALDDKGMRLEAGRVNATHLRMCVMDGAGIYCCAPAEMQKSVLALFREMGVRPGAVQREHFFW